MSTDNNKQKEDELLNINNNPQTLNNWDDKQEETIRGWKTSLVQYIFIYQYVLDSAQTHVNRINVVVEILGAFSLLISTISASIMGFSKIKPDGFNANITIYGTPIIGVVEIIGIALAICVAIISSIVLVLNRTIKIYKWDTTIVACSAYISMMDQLNSIISVELSLGRNARGDANKFVKDISVRYLDLIKNSPYVDINDQNNAMNQYEKFSQGKINAFNSAQKYTKYDNDVSVI